MMRAPTIAALGRRGRARMRKQAVRMPAAKTNNIDPHRTAMLILFAIQLLLKKTENFWRERREFKEHML